MWVPRIELRLPGLLARPFTGWLSHFAGPRGGGREEQKDFMAIVNFLRK